MGIEAAGEGDRSPTIAGALGWGFLTAAATGPFGILLFVLALIAKDPLELLQDPMEILGSLASLLAFGSILAIAFGLIIGWLPISLLGWVTAKAAARWPAFRHPAAWAGIGAAAGGLHLALLGGTIDDILKDTDPANWQRLRDMAAFGGACGLFAALFFRRLAARRSP